ncbi:F-box only protein 44 isoform X2 [Solenopsis invicta]|nr:F-box only protein 44 isoform X2 [Solenopsis invicta]XP_025991480.1 F-box only protein 44 isoform X2 [Solenopsis invicta]
MMGQFNTVPSTPRVPFDEEGDNGLVLCDTYLPVEVLIEIFCRADCKTLVNCQLVCKRWRMLMNYVWHKKTEQALGKPFPWNDKMPWSVFYLACTKKPYERNLLKNHSGAEGIIFWTMIYNGGSQWTIEEPPVGAPELPQTELMFKDRQTCFATSFERCTKMQHINLIKEGIHPYILDTYQPPIVVSEWYSCRWDCPAVYRLEVKLMAEDEPLDEFKFQDVLEGEKQNRWLQVSHVFENYGTGLRVIRFEHGGKDRSYWAGHYGSKMAGACVTVKIPENMHS